MKCLRVLTCTVLTLLSTAVLAQASPRYYLRDRVGSAKMIPDWIAYARDVPIDKRYEDFSADEKARLAAMYESMGPNDEPPFPADGRRLIIKALHRAQERLLVTGALDLVVDVSAEGEATRVSVLRSPSKQMTQFAVQLMMLTRFKPALCDGVPCAQQYPFAIGFTVDE